MKQFWSWVLMSYLSHCRCKTKTVQRPCSTSTELSGKTKVSIHSVLGTPPNRNRGVASFNTSRDLIILRATTAGDHSTSPEGPGEARLHTNTQKSCLPLSWMEQWSLCLLSLGLGLQMAQLLRPEMCVRWHRRELWQHTVQAEKVCVG